MREKDFILKYGLEKGNPLLTTITKRIRRGRPKIPSDLKYTIFEAGEFAQIWLKTRGCAYSKVGSCTCCDYWEGDDVYEVVGEFEEALSKLKSTIKGLLIETSGSVLDSNEISNQELAMILEMVNERQFKKLVIETHLNTITAEKLSVIRNKVKETEICIEAGVESLSKDILRYSLNKSSVLTAEIEEIVELIHASGCNFIANIMLGVPFVSVSQQIEDAVTSINKLFEIGADYIMLFPVNIKEYTLVNWMYQKGLYERVNGQMILEVLKQVKKKYINRIDVVWYGNRKQKNPAYKNPILGPHYCEKCENKLMDFFFHFNILDDAEKRIKLLEAVTNTECDCKQELRRKLDMARKDGTDKFDYMDSIYTRIKTLEREEQK